MQDEIPKAEAKLAELDDALIAAATDHAKVTELARQREQVQSAVDGLYAEWEALEEAVG